MKKAPLYLSGALALVAAGLLLIQSAKPQTPPPQPPPQEPIITWSVQGLSQAMFPGTGSVTTVSFRSDQNLTGVVVVVTPSVKDLVSATPANFASIAANQNYQITLTLTAPPGFVKRSFGGTLQLRNATDPLKTYATPLALNLRTDFSSYSNQTLGISLSYPLNWQINPADPLTTTTLYLVDQAEEHPGGGLTLNVLPGPLSALLPDPSPQLPLVSSTTNTFGTAQWFLFVHRESDSGLEFLTALAQMPGGQVLDVSAQNTTDLTVVVMSVLQSVSFR